MGSAHEQLDCVFERTLPEKTACYQLSDGHFILFNKEAPYTTRAVDPGGFFCVTSYPSIEENLTCAGVYHNALYLYSMSSSPLHRITYKFYRMTIDFKKTIQCSQINEIQAENDILISPINSLSMYVILGWIVFSDLRISRAVLSRWDSSFLYLITQNNLIIFNDSSVLKFIILTCGYHQRRMNFESYFCIIGEQDGVIRISECSPLYDTIDLWNVTLEAEYYVKNTNRKFKKDDELLARRTVWNNLIILINQKVEPRAVKLAIHPNIESNVKRRENEKVSAQSQLYELNATTEKVNELNAATEKLRLTDDMFASDFLKNFKPVKVLGQGGNGCVFDAVFKLIGARYAVKRIPLRDSDVNRALKEVCALAAFDHQGIVRYNNAWIEKPPVGWQRWSDQQLLKELNSTEYFTYRDDCAFLYIQMELCESTLFEWLNINKDRDLQTMKAWFKEIVCAVAYIHRKGKIHRDLKPSNILITKCEGKYRLKICDLGIVADIDSTVTRTFAQGTTMYMAPEQVWGGYSAKVDIFALGLILTQLCVVMTTDEAKEVFNCFRAGKASTVLDILPAVKEIVAWLVNLDDSVRPDCESILEHPFLA